MQEQIAKILQMVEDGKITAHDAQGLIEAIKKVSEVTPPPPQESVGPTPPPPPPVEEARATTTDSGTSFDSIAQSIEKIGRDIANGINWKDVQDHVRVGAEKGLDAIKHIGEQIRDGKIGFMFGEVERRDIVLPLRVTEGQILVLENFAGDVTVNFQSSENKVSANASFRGETRVDAVSKSEEYTLMIEESEHAVCIRQADRHDAKIDLVVELTSPMQLELKTGGGNVFVVGGKNVKVEAKSGNIKCEHSTGLFEISAQSGNVDITDCHGTIVNLEAKSGNIQISRTHADSLNARSASGDFFATALTCKTVSVEAVTGNVRAEFENCLDGSVNLRTVSGNIYSLVPDGCNCRVSLSTVKGDVSCQLELDEAMRQPTQITGQMGSGAGSFTASAVSGNVNLALQAQPVSSTSSQ